MTRCMKEKPGGKHFAVVAVADATSMEGHVTSINQMYKKWIHIAALFSSSEGNYMSNHERGMTKKYNIYHGKQLMNCE